MTNAREAAYLALMESLREERFITDSLESWRLQAKPSSRDFQFARQIAYGAAQMALALDYLATQLTEKKKLSLKLKEKALLRLALYQYAFLQRVPIYAITDEMLELAKKYCHRNFVSFLNAILRNASKGLPSLPQDDSPNDLSIRYSYPLFFVESMLQTYGLEATKQVLEAQNHPARIMARLRTSESSDLELFCKEPCCMAFIDDVSQLSEIANSNQYYIQNATPAVLISNLAQQMRTKPKRILDLCASPGGKLLAVHDAFPEAVLYANDTTPEKLKQLSENCVKYGLEAILSCTRGEEFQSKETFDLIILDVPCSNSGVLNKRPEARWRLNSESLDALKALQMKLIANAVTLLAPHGELWYMTCSILPEENEVVVSEACREFALEDGYQQLILPSKEGWDGGFACVLRNYSV